MGDLKKTSHRPYSNIGMIQNKHPSIYNQ